MDSQLQVREIAEARGQIRRGVKDLGELITASPENTPMLLWDVLNALVAEVVEICGLATATAASFGQFSYDGQIPAKLTMLRPQLELEYVPEDTYNI